MSLNKDAVENNLDFIREAYRTNSQEFLIAFFLYEINGTKKEELTEDMINSVEKILDETEYWYDDLMRDKIRNIKTEILKNQLSDSLTNYIDNCTVQEWNKLLNEYNVSDEENYMGEVRENLEESIMEYFEDEELENQEEMLEFFKKYDVIEKEQEEELER